MIKKSMVLMVVALLLWGTALSADSPVPRDDDRRPMMMRHMNRGLQMVEQNLYPPRLLRHLADEIGLSAEQLTRIREMDLKHQEWVVKRMADARVQRLRFQTLFEAKTVDRKALEKAIRHITELQTEIQLARINHLLDIRDLLTPEQIKKIDAGKRSLRRRNWQRGMREEPRMRPSRPQMRD